MIRALLWTVIFLFVLQVTYAQTKEELLEQRDKILKDITLTNKLIKNTREQKGTTVQSIKLLNKKISDRQLLINNYSNEITIIERKIADRQLTIDQLQEELERQKRLYADILRYSYKNHNYYSKAIYLLASESLNQFYLRKKYLEQLNVARNKKVELIHGIERRINYEISELEGNKLEIGDALLKTKAERNNLRNEQKRRENALSSLKSEEKKLKRDLDDKIKMEEELSKTIEAIIREEAKKNSFAALTPEQQLVSDDFSRNKGKLPWPTRQGIITEKFGEHFHPVIRGVKVRNNGVDISTIDNSAVRTIFDGQVTKIASIKGSNYTVIIRHGHYYTIYHNLKNVRVNVGESVKTKDVIGYVAKDKINDNSVLHLEIWKGFDKLNPEEWISN
jgi:septal ring factor EnvC (AmiA/AmiB activator)